jgi:hypothetical protein
MWPNSVALDKQGHVYVSDDWLTRIAGFDKVGKPQDEGVWQPFSSGVEKLSEGLSVGVISHGQAL